ncbi:MAG: hypothetical protein KIS80_02340 [Anaerolineales bacterium]|nr:hypothetical protein [Anaerolineales bacterium]
MLDWSKLLSDSSLFITLFTAIVLYVAIRQPRLFLNKEDVPPDILAAVPPKTEAETRRYKIVLSLLMLILIGGPFYSTLTFAQQSAASWPTLWLYAFLAVLAISTFDLLFIDWFILNTLTPAWSVFPGTQGLAGYKDYGFHGRAHLKLLPMQVLGALLIAGLVSLLT